MKVTRILHPTDFSDASDQALPHAVQFARQFNAELTIIHVRTLFPEEGSIEELSPFEVDRYTELLEKQLQQIAERLTVKGTVRTVLKHCVSAAKAILEFSEEDVSDLIVMGTHGRSALGRFFLGSVAEKVVRFSSVPVITVSSAQKGYRSDPNYRRILATFDFSEHSKKAVLRAVELAEAFGARLQVLNVVDQGIYPGYYDEWRQQLQSELPQIAAEAARMVADTFVEHGLENTDICVEIGSGDGKVFREISRFARQNQIDLIVMGTYGLSGVEHMLLGSTTERVVRTAPCPVYAFHLPR